METTGSSPNQKSQEKRLYYNSQERRIMSSDEMAPDDETKPIPMLTSDLALKWGLRKIGRP